MKCVHLHCHSEYSSLDGGSRVSDMPKKLKELGMNAMALTDHGVMQGLPEFYETLKKEDIKPILGLEAYLTNDRFDKARNTTTWHLTLLAETTEGYHNLCKFSSWAFIEGTIITVGRPRARGDWDLLQKYSEGVICLSGCMAGPVMNPIFSGDLQSAKQNLQKMVDIFGKENVYGEIQNVGITTAIPGDSELAKKLGKTPFTEEDSRKWMEDNKGFSDDIEPGEVPLSQTEANRELAEMCQELELKLVATGDVHYLEEDDAYPHDAMVCIGTKQVQRGNRRFSLLPKTYHMRTYDELKEALPEWPEALETTLEIAERCNADINFGKELLPKYPIPEDFSSSQAYLLHLCEEGFKTRYPEDSDFYQDAKERLAVELGVINSMGFNDYFLIVWDLFNEANKRGIPSGPGRGSAAGSIVAYCLDITKICPLKNKLLFERFLNPDRKSMPDIDMDFGVVGREELIEYSKEKYNKLANCETAVAQIVTFGKFKAKGALRDAARVLAEPTEDGRKEALKIGDKLASYIPGDPNATMRTVWEDKYEGEQLRRAFKQGGLQAQIIKQAGWLEGFVKSYGIHAAAVLISDHDLTNDLPLQKLDKDGPITVQYDMGYSERLGLLKMDFLGLRNLDIIWDACEKIEHVHGVKIHPYKDIPLDDKNTYELFARGESVGTFQFESPGMQGALREVQPTEFNDLVALVALYRPGPMAHIPHYAARKHGREEVTYLDPRLEDIQGETYGITVYQEQSMLLARTLANFTPGEADDLRKAIGKKLHDKMAALKPKFLSGCKENGVPKEVAETLWKDNEAAADYSFNKSHAACYAYVSYITGYLKANYPNEYMAALLSSVMGKKDKPRLYLTEAKRMGLSVLPPDINRSLKDFAVLEKEDQEEVKQENKEYDILFGLTAIRGVGGAVVSQIKEERDKNGPFASMFELIRRMPSLSKSSIQALVKAGALDNTGPSRQAMFNEVEEATVRIKKEKKAEEKAFFNLIKNHFESLPAKEGELETKKGLRKLSSLEKKALEAQALLFYKNEEVPDEEVEKRVIYEACEKEELRVIRARLRSEIKEKKAEIAGILGEDSSGDDKEILEAKAQLELKDKQADIIKETEKCFTEFHDKIKEELEAHLDQKDIEAALAEENDPPLDAKEWTKIEKLNLERQVLEIYVTGHPLDEDAKKWARYVDKGLGHITSEQEGEVLRVVGALVGKTPIKIRSGETMYKLVLEDLTGSKEVIVFPKTLEGGLDELLEVGQVICLDVGVQEDSFQKAKQEEQEEEAESSDEKPIKLIASRIYKWDPTKIKPPQKDSPIKIEISKEHFNKEWVNKLRELCKDHPGNNPIRLSLDGKDYKTELLVEPSSQLQEDIRTLLSS